MSNMLEAVSIEMYLSDRAHEHNGDQVSSNGPAVIDLITEAYADAFRKIAYPTDPGARTSETTLDLGKCPEGWCDDGMNCYPCYPVAQAKPGEAARPALFPRYPSPKIIF
jgi:hypothetical protein